MPTVSRSAVGLTSGRPADLPVDLLFVPLFEGENPASALADLDKATGGFAQRAVDNGEFQARPFEMFVTPLSGWKPARVALIGAGKAADFNTERLRKLATAAGLSARQRRLKRIAFLNRGGGEPTAAIQAITEGLVMASF